MNCCPACFNETQYTLFSLMEDLSEESGNCDFCGSKDVEVVDVRDIAEFFKPLMEIYETDHSANTKNTLNHELKNKWHIFSDKTQPNVSLFLEKIIEYLGKQQYNDLINAQNVQFNFIDRNQFEEEWSNLKTEIKKRNRFFFRAFKPDELEKILLNNESVYRKDSSFYRARLCDSEEGLPKDKMGKPPVEKARSGRANPFGIPYLYLSLEEKTVIHEVRAFHYDYVTIARFKAEEDLKILSLKAPSFYDNDPFMEGDLKKTLSAISFLETLDQELSKPMRRNDSILEYLPTQYICELAKNLEFDGIEYRSTLYPQGTNVAIFHDEKVSIEKLWVVEIRNVIIESKEI